MNIKSKWYAQIEILEKFKKKLEKKLKEYNEDKPSEDLDVQIQDNGQKIELSKIIEELGEEIYDIQEHGINCLRDEEYE